MAYIKKTEKGLPEISNTGRPTNQAALAVVARARSSDPDPLDPDDEASARDRSSIGLLSVRYSSDLRFHKSETIFPYKERRPVEAVTATDDKGLDQGATLPNLIRSFYPGTVPRMIKSQFPFLGRDAFIRNISFVETDPYVASPDKALPTAIKRNVHRINDELIRQWRQLGLPLKQDKDRECDRIDASVAWQALRDDHPLHSLVIANRSQIYQLIANDDIIHKTSTTRSVPVGWWAVSYAGKQSKDPSYFEASIRAHEAFFENCSRSNVFKERLESFWRDTGDPLDTNPGYPFFVGRLSSNNYPITRERILRTYRNVVLQGNTWDETIEKIDSLCPDPSLKGFPLAISPIRRIQQGYKWARTAYPSPAGLRLGPDIRGFNSTRVAWNVSWLYNVLTSPFSTGLKALRYFLPGCYHDGPSKKPRMENCGYGRENTEGGAVWLAEADYSNYDRFLPIDLMLRLAKSASGIFADSERWYDSIKFLQDESSIIWPDHTTLEKGFGWLFKPGRLGLLSGVKATSDLGTIVNSVVNLQACMNALGWSNTQAVAYLSQYLDGSAIGTKKEHYFVQSDDTLLIANSAATLYRRGEEFVKATNAAGLKGSINLSDRFLMRHTDGGKDLPVASRVYQNTIQPEDSAENKLVFLAGLASRTDGMNGFRTTDAFSLGGTYRVPDWMRDLNLTVLEALLDHVGSARVPIPQAIELLSDLRDLKVADVGARRRTIIRDLAAYELATNTAGSDGLDVSSWMYSLYRDRHSPTNALLLDQLQQTLGNTAAAGVLRNALNSMASREHTFFQHAIASLGVGKPVIRRR